MTTLQAAPRTVQKKKNETLRAAGSVPCVLYGPKIDPVSLQVSSKELERVYGEAGSSTLVTLAFKEGKKDGEHVILIHDIQRHPVTRHMIHADFYELPLDKEITLSVPLVLDGEAPGVQNEGGTLVQNMHEIEIRALPAQLPPELRADISSLLHVEDSLHIKNIALPEGVTVTHDPEITIAFVEAPRAEEVFDEDQEEEDLDAIQTEGEVKREEEEQEEQEDEAAGE